MDGRHPGNQDPNSGHHSSNQDANNLLDAQNFEADLQALQAEDFENPPEGDDFSDDGWQGPVRGNHNDIGEEEEEGQSDFLVSSEDNERNPPVV